MATVVITFFLITQFYVCKMDADYRERRRNISQREKRWSMNSQRLEEIVAELMKPISDVRRSFDTDLSALLEEYLTEAGLHALDAEEGEGNGTIPNFAELALLLQQSASIYSRKVDFLYQHVLNVSESLQNSTQEEVVAGAAEGAALASPARRKRKASQHEEFGPVALEASAAARREAGQPRPPPTLPRMYVELEPRVLAAADAPLADYSGEPIGLLADFHVTWRLQDGLLVEELAGGGIHMESSLRALPLTELQAAIEAAAPPSPPPCFTPPSSPRAASPAPASSTPLPATPLGEPAAPATPPPDKRERKRRSDGDLELLDGTVKLTMSKKLRRRLQRVEEFSVPREWLGRVVRARAAAVRAARRALAEPALSEFRGFDISDSIDVGGFLGWSSSEAGAARAASLRRDDSDDDGFFEQSSLGDSDTSRTDDCAPAATALASLPGAAPEWAAWRERVVARAAAAEARGVDIQRCAGALLAAARALPPRAAFPALLARTASDQADVSKLFLATLFLANAGNVEIIQGPPLTLNSFSVRLVSTDERLYRAAAADEQFLR